MIAACERGTVAAAEELRRAGEIVSIGTSIGFDIVVTASCVTGRCVRLLVCALPYSNIAGITAFLTDVTATDRDVCKDLGLPLVTIAIDQFVREISSFGGIPFVALPEGIGVTTVEKILTFLQPMGVVGVAVSPDTTGEYEAISRFVETKELLEIDDRVVALRDESLIAGVPRGPAGGYRGETNLALYTHSVLSVKDRRYGLFHPENPFRLRPIRERIAIYAGFARRSDRFRSESMINAAPELPRG